MPLDKNNFNTINLFINSIRQLSNKENIPFNEQLHILIKNNSNNKNLIDEFNVFCNEVLDKAFLVKAFTDYGINSNRGFFPEIISRFKHKILPENSTNNELSNYINLIFYKAKDYLWLQKIDDKNWIEFGKLLNSQLLKTHSKKLVDQNQNAILILCNRLTSIGIDPYLVSKLPKADDNDSPFFELNHSVTLFVKKHIEIKGLEINDDELNSVWKCIYKCEQIFVDLQNKKDELGTSLHLTFIVQRAQQQIERIKLLLNIFIAKQQNQSNSLAISHLVTQLTIAEQTKNNLRSFIKQTTNLLAYRIVSHTSEKGEHYIGFNKKENKKLLYSSMGGGLVVVLLVFIKHFIHQIHASLFFEGILFGLNYGLGFVLMHLIHFTLATKQPSMTASFIASSINNGNNNIKPYDTFKQIITSQFISLIGNLVIVLPVCFIIAWISNYFYSNSVFDLQETKSQLYSNHPLYSASLVYAAIAGVLLSLSGVVIGYVDNKVIYSEIAERIIKHPKLRSVYSFEKRVKIAKFIEKNLGAIIGNLFLGFCLGFAGNWGKFIGIPFDIRHVTISSGNLGIALGSDSPFNLALVVTVFFGVILIGLVNIASSFLISFIIACRARNLSWKQSFKVLIGRKINT